MSDPLRAEIERLVEAAESFFRDMEGVALDFRLHAQVRRLGACAQAVRAALRSTASRDDKKREVGDPPQEERCPQCGYTWADVHELMDHRYCSGPGPGGPDTYPLAPSSRSPEPEGGGRDIFGDIATMCEDKVLRYYRAGPEAVAKRQEIIDNVHAVALRAYKALAPAPEEAATLPKRALRPLTGDTLKDACRRLSPPPALEDMDLAGPEEAATGTCQKCDGTTLVIDSAGEPADCTACNNGRAPVLRREGAATGTREDPR